MPFVDKFNEAAQNAALRLIEADEWRGCGWLAKLVEQQVRLTLTTTAVTTVDPHEMKKSGTGQMMAAGRDSDDYPNKPNPVQLYFAASQVVSSEENQASASDGASFQSNDFSHVDGYDWRIIVADRMKNHNNSWAEHFNRAPTQEEFEKQFQHFHARTHHVHVNSWVNGEWVTITENYVTHWRKEKPEESFTTTEQWEEGKQWRIKFWDQRVNRFNYVYFDYKPGGISLNKYHSSKCYAVTERRPDGV